MAKKDLDDFVRTLRFYKNTAADESASIMSKEARVLVNKLGLSALVGGGPQQQRGSGSGGRGGRGNDNDTCPICTTAFDELVTAKVVFLEGCMHKVKERKEKKTCDYFLVKCWGLYWLRP